MAGHPCSSDCCGNPDIVTPEHNEPEGDEFCEECYGAECQNCGDLCYCDL